MKSHSWNNEKGQSEHEGHQLTGDTHLLNLLHVSNEPFLTS